MSHRKKWVWIRAFKITRSLNKFCSWLRNIQGTFCLILFRIISISWKTLFHSLAWIITLLPPKYDREDAMSSPDHMMTRVSVIQWEVRKQTTLAWASQSGASTGSSWPMTDQQGRLLTPDTRPAPQLCMGPGALRSQSRQSGRDWLAEMRHEMRWRGHQWVHAGHYKC